MTQDANASALEDTHARLLALEMVTTAVLNRLALDDRDVQAVLHQLASPSDLPKAAEAGGVERLDHLQANVARLATAIATPL